MYQCGQPLSCFFAAYSSNSTKSHCWKYTVQRRPTSWVSRLHWDCELRYCESVQIEYVNYLQYMCTSTPRVEWCKKDRVFCQDFLPHVTADKLCSHWCSRRPGSVMSTLLMNRFIMYAVMTVWQMGASYVHDCLPPCLTSSKWKLLYCALINCFPFLNYRRAAVIN